MHRVHVSSYLKYEIESPTLLLINIAAAMTDYQYIENETVTVTPYVEAEPLLVGSQKNRFHRLQLLPGTIELRYGADIRLTPVTQFADTITQTDQGLLPAEALIYLNPSRYCESDRLSQIAFSMFGHLPQDFARVNHVCDWIFQHLSYQPGTTDHRTTACDVFLQRTGVCRDFAHLAITFCRALGVPARYVSGYACQLEPPDFHGFFEAYMNGRWYLFDPSRLAPPAGLVRVGVGRDAAETAFATTWGDAKLSVMEVGAHTIDGDDGILGAATDATAVSTA